MSTEEEKEGELLPLLELALARLWNKTIETDIEVYKRALSDPEFAKQVLPKIREIKERQIKKREVIEAKRGEIAEVLRRHNVPFAAYIMYYKYAADAATSPEDALQAIKEYYIKAFALDPQILEEIDRIVRLHRSGT